MALIQPIPIGMPGPPGSEWDTVVDIPSDSEGVDGDFRLIATTGDVYQKIDGSWELVANIKGEQGVPGEPGDPGVVSVGTYLIAGATLVWVSDYTYRVGAASYYIAGTLYSSIEQSKTLDAADQTYDRIDVLVLDSNGTLSFVKGTPAEIPAQPVVDYTLYVPVTFVFVEAQSSEAPVTNEDIYLEGVEWTVTPSDASIVVDSTNNPRTGTKCIEGTNVSANDYLTAVNGEAIDLADYNNLVLYIRCKASWPKQKALQFVWLNGTVQRGNTVTVGNGYAGFNSQLVGSYQQVVLPLTSFAISPGVLVDRLRVTMAGGAGDVGFYLDDIFLQAGIGGGGVVQVVTYRGEWSSAISYATNDVVFYLNSSYICLVGHVNHAPGPNSEYWGILALGPQEDSLVSSGLNVSAGSSQTFNLSWLNRGLVYYLKVEETGGSMVGTYDIEVYGKDTFLMADLMYKAEDIDPSEDFEDFLPWRYEDRDVTREFHLKIINNDGSNGGTFTITVNAEKYA